MAVGEDLRREGANAPLEGGLASGPGGQRRESPLKEGGGRRWTEKKDACAAASGADSTGFTALLEEGGPRSEAGVAGTAPEAKLLSFRRGCLVRGLAVAGSSPLFLFFGDGGCCYGFRSSWQQQQPEFPLHK